MTNSSLPADAQNLTEPTSTELAQRVQQVALPWPLTPAPIATTYVCLWGKHPASFVHPRL